MDYIRKGVWNMLENLQGIGPKTINMLNMMGIYNVLDLLRYYPCRYDILKRSDISNLRSRDRVVTSGVIDGQPTMIFITEKFRKIIFRVNTGSGILNITVYNRNSLYKDLAQGKVVTVIGIYDRSKNTVIASSVRFEELPVSPKIDSVYRLYNVMSKKGFEKVLKSGMDFILNDSDMDVDGNINRDIDKDGDSDVDRELVRVLQGSLPDFIIDRYNFLSVRKAIAEVHHPSDITMLKRARKRLKYEEMFNYLIRNRYLAKRIRDGKRYIKRRDFSKDVYGFIEKAGIVLSTSQRECIGEILGDFNRTGRMYRMIMGDRFSGKFLCGMMGCYFNFLAGHKCVILVGSDRECEYVMGRIGEIGEKMGMRIGVRGGMERDRDMGRNMKGDRKGNLVSASDRASDRDRTSANDRASDRDNKVGSEIDGVYNGGVDGLIGEEMGYGAGGSKSDIDYDLLGELRGDDSGRTRNSVKAQNGGFIGEAIYNKEREMVNGDADGVAEGAAEADFWGDFDVVICNWNLLRADMSKCDVGLCVVYSGARGLMDFGALRIFMDCKADILCISDVAISEKRDGLLYEGLDVSRVSAGNGNGNGNGMRPVSVDVRVCKGKDRDAVLRDMEACLDRGRSVVVVQSERGGSGNGVGDGDVIEGVLRGVSGSEMGEMEIGFGEALQEWFGARSEGDVDGDGDGDMDRNRNVNLNVDGDGNSVSGDRSLESDRNLESVRDKRLESDRDGDKYRNLESDRNSDRVVLQTGNDSDKGILLREIGEFISGKARILLISSEEFDWLDSRGMVEDIICDGNMGMLVIDGGEEYSLARLHGYRCMMAGNNGKLKRDWNGNGKLMNKDVMGEEIKNGNNRINKEINKVINKEIKNEKNNEIKNEKNGSNLERTGTNLENKIEEKIEIRNFYNRESDLIEEKGINDLDKVSKEKRNMIFDIILNDNEKDLEFFENVMNGFVISDYDFMYKGNEEFDWVRRGAGGMFICNVKKDFNMMERVKDDVDKYFELFLDNSTWSEKVLRG